MFQCLPGLYIALFDKVPEEAKYHPLTRFALMALARKKTVGAAAVSKLPGRSVFRFYSNYRVGVATASRKEPFRS